MCRIANSVLLIALAAAMTTLPAAASTPLEALLSLTMNAGNYSNRIANFIPPLDYTEICFKNGNLLWENNLGGVHPAASISPTCVPGDIGFIIENDERAALKWSEAKVDMTLPGPWEFKFACDRDATFQLLNMRGNWEHEGNTAWPIQTDRSGIVTMIMGSPSCAHASWDWIANQDGIEAVHEFRCKK